MSDGRPGPAPPVDAPARGSLAPVVAGLAAAAALLALAVWLVVRALEPGLPLGVHGFRLWLATLPAWIAAGVLLALVGEPSGGARRRAGQALLLAFALLSPPTSGALCGAVRWFQTARLSSAFREDAVAAPATVTAVRWRTRTVEQERPRRSVEVTTPYLVLEYRPDGSPRSLERDTDEATARAYAEALRARTGPEREGVPFSLVAWFLPGAPDRPVLAPADARPAYPVAGIAPTLLCGALTVALVVGYRRGQRGERTVTALVT